MPPTPSTPIAIQVAGVVEREHAALREAYRRAVGRASVNRHTPDDIAALSAACQAFNWTSADVELDVARNQRRVELQGQVHDAEQALAEAPDPRELVREVCAVDEQIRKATDPLLQRKRELLDQLDGRDSRERALKQARGALADHQAGIGGGDYETIAASVARMKD